MDGLHGGIPNEYWDIFRNVELWRDVSEEQIEELAHTARMRGCSKGKTIFAEASIPDRLLVVLAGHVIGVHYDSAGHGTVIEHLGPGSVIGLIALFSEMPYMADICCADEDTITAEMPLSSIADLVQKTPQVALQMVRDISRRYTGVVGVLMRNTATVPGRVSRYLLSLPRHELLDGEYIVQLPMSRVDLAMVLATTPESLSRAFHGLQDQGVLNASDRMVEVHDEGALRVLAEATGG